MEATTAELSTPPERKAPSGTSEIRRSFVASSSVSRISSSIRATWAAFSTGRLGDILSSQ